MLDLTSWVSGCEGSQGRPKIHTIHSIYPPTPPPHLGVENSLIGLYGFDHGLDLGEASVGSQIFRWTLTAMMNGVEGLGWEKFDV
jgi:hypothetical protein